MTTTTDAERHRNRRGRKSPEAEAFANWLRRTRESMGLGSAELATKAGLARGAITELEQGIERPNRPLNVYTRLAEGLELELGFVLHKAGFKMGDSGVNMARLQRTEDIIEMLATRAPEIRAALAEAMLRLDTIGNDVTLDRCGRALGALDLVTERLREGRQA